MVCYAQENGNKAAARVFHTSPVVVRKWVQRFKLQGYEALKDRSRRPHTCPKETPPELKEHIITLKKKYKRLGAEQIKILENVSLSAKTMRKIWRKAGISSRKRRKKHITKNNLRKIKKEYQLFQRVCEDTKYLTDIPEY